MLLEWFTTTFTKNGEVRVVSMSHGIVGPVHYPKMSSSKQPLELYQCDSLAELNPRVLCTYGFVGVWPAC